MTDYFVHESSVVGEGATIGKGTKIWHFGHVMAGAVIGADCNIGQNVFVMSGAKIGNRVKIQNNVSVYDGVVIEDDVFCGPSMVFTNVINPRAFVSRKEEFKRTLVRRGASIGANATVLCGTTLGEYCVVGAGAVVTKNVPAYGIVTGVPARRAGWACRCGVSLAGAGTLTCAACGTKYVESAGALAPMEPK